MGMYVTGDIALLAAIARPTIGVVTAVATHLERAGSLDAIERGKRELVEALPREGTAVLNADDPRVNRMREYTSARVLRYGFAQAVDVAAEEIQSLGEEGMRSASTARPDPRRGATPALGAIRCTTRLRRRRLVLRPASRPTRSCAAWKRGFRAPHRTHCQRRRVAILDDSYNASPDSMAAALELLATLPGRHVAVLGEMLELGEGSDDATARFRWCTGWPSDCGWSRNWPPMPRRPSSPADSSYPTTLAGDALRQSDRPWPGRPVPFCRPAEPS